MNKETLRNFPKSSTLLVSIVIGSLVGVGVYQAAVKGILPLKVRLPATASVEPGQKIQTIVDEENAVIDVTEPWGISLGSLSIRSLIITD